MKQIIFILLLAGLGISFSYKTPPRKTMPLEGTWKLVSANWYDNNPKYTNSAIYKIYTGGRFAFIYFDTKTGKFQGAGGGTYTVDNSKFSEKLEYFSWDSTAVGTSQTFDFKIEGNRFIQSGLLNSEKYKDYEIKEVYEKVEDGISAAKSKHPLIGVWNIESAQYGPEKTDIQKVYGKVIKIITPGHFVTAFFNPDTKQFNGSGFGTWKVEGNNYTEKVLMFSWDDTMVNTEPKFTWEVKNNKFHQRGKIDSKEYQDYTIEEVSKRLE